MMVKCPSCKKPVEFGMPDFPFCSERCRLIDLGRWADEEFKIPAEPSSSESRPNELQDEEGQ